MPVGWRWGSGVGLAVALFGLACLFGVRTPLRVLVPLAALVAVVCALSLPFPRLSGAAGFATAFALALGPSALVVALVVVVLGPGPDRRTGVTVVDGELRVTVVSGCSGWRVWCVPVVRADLAVPAGASVRREGALLIVERADPMAGGVAPTGLGDGFFAPHEIARVPCSPQRVATLLQSRVRLLPDVGVWTPESHVGRSPAPADTVIPLRFGPPLRR